MLFVMTVRAFKHCKCCHHWKSKKTTTENALFLTGRLLRKILRVGIFDESCLHCYRTLKKKKIYSLTSDGYCAWANMFCHGHVSLSIISCFGTFRDTCVWVCVCRWMCRRVGRPFARVKIARSTPCTRLPSTRLAKLPCMHKVSLALFAHDGFLEVFLTYINVYNFSDLKPTCCTR